MEALNVLKSKWLKMTEKLINDDLENALNYFSVYTREENRMELSNLSVENGNAM